jgi:hypothetical protein
MNARGRFLSNFTPQCLPPPNFCSGIPNEANNRHIFHRKYVMKNLYYKQLKKMLIQFLGYGTV